MEFTVRSRNLVEKHTRYLGIDPGLNRTGYALIERTARGPVLREGGVIQSTQSLALHQRVHETGCGLREVLATGSGKAPKDQMQLAVKAALKLANSPEPNDVADASAVALCLYHSVRFAA